MGEDLNDLNIAVGKIAEMAPAASDETLLREMSEKMSTAAVSVLHSYASIAHAGEKEIHALGEELSRLNFFEIFMIAKNGMLHVTDFLNSLS